MMTQRERMKAGLIYDPGDSKIMEAQMPYLDKLWEFNRLKPSDSEGNPCRVLREVGEHDREFFIKMSPLIGITC